MGFFEDIVTLGAVDATVEYITQEELDGLLDEALKELGMTYEELRAEGLSGKYSSERARNVWFTFAPVGEYNC